jgi:glutamate/tyrosine decarboxylase-like PLP-dependent enzyme
MEMAGLGRAALRLIPVDAAHRVELSALESAIVADRAAGRLPFLVVASAGTVDVGAVDDLGAVAEVCHTAGLWFHVDAAFGAMARLSSRHRMLLTGIEAADSVAFDFHKWLQVPYDAGCIVVRHAEWHARTFASQPAYLQREHAGIAAGQPWPTDFGPDLSRGFRALKVWMTLKAYGAAHLGALVDHHCTLAQHLAARIDADARLERLAPVALNIVCFRHRAPDGEDVDAFNARIVRTVQDSGVAVPSTTRVNGQLAIRVAIVNHRTTQGDVDRLLDTVLMAAQALLAR